MPVASTQHRFGHDACSISTTQQPHVALATAQFSNLGSSHRLFLSPFSSHYAWVTWRDPNPHISSLASAAALKGVCGVSKTSQPSQTPCLWISEWSHRFYRANLHNSATKSEHQLTKQTAELNTGQGNLVLSSRNRKEKESTFFQALLGFHWGNSSRISQHAAKSSMLNKGISGEKSSYLNYIYTCTGVKHNFLLYNSWETCRKPVSSSCTPLEIGH